MSVNTVRIELDSGKVVIHDKTFISNEEFMLNKRASKDFYPQRRHSVE